MLRSNSCSADSCSAAAACSNVTSWWFIIERMIAICRVTSSSRCSLVLSMLSPFCLGAISWSIHARDHIDTDLQSLPAERVLQHHTAIHPCFARTSAPRWSNATNRNGSNVLVLPALWSCRTKTDSNRQRYEALRKDSKTQRKRKIIGVP